MRRQIRTQLSVETLEDRLAPSTNGVTPPIMNLPPVLLVQTEVEPNNSIAQANEIVMQPSILPYPMAPVATVAPATPAPNNALAYPYPYPQGTASGEITGSLDNTAVVVDADYFSIAVTPQSKITLSLSGAAVTNGAELQLLDSAGNVLAAGQATPVSYFTSGGGTFYVRIGSAANASQPASGAYSLSASFGPDYLEEHEPNDTLAQANAIRMFPSLFPAVLNQYGIPWFGSQQSGSITGSLDNTAAGNDVDYFSFTAEAQRKITLTLSGDAASAGATMQLLDAAGNVLAAAQGNSLSYYTSGGGTLYVRIGSPAQPAAGAYSLSVFTADDPFEEHEPNNTLATANPILVNAPYPMMYGSPTPAPANPPGAMPIYPYDIQQQSGYITGSLDNSAAGNDVDYFSFTADAQRKITLTLSGDASSAGAIMDLLDAAGNVLATSQAGSLNYYTTGGGAFYVRVGTAANASQPAAGAYTLSVTSAYDPYEEHEPNDSFATANPIVLTSPLYLGGPGPIPTPSSGPGPIPMPGGGPVPIPTPAIGPGPIPTPAIGPGPIPMPGGGIGPIPTSGGGTAPIYGSPDGSLSGYVTGQMDTHADGSADQDFFSFSADANHSIHLGLSGALAANGGRITLYDASDAQLVSAASSLAWSVQTGGTFFVRVDQPTGGAAAATQYRLDVTTQLTTNPVQGPDEQEPNNTFAQANTLALQSLLPPGAFGVTMRTGAAMGIAGGPTQDHDFFKFDIQAGEHVQVGLNGFVCDTAGGVFASIPAWIVADHVPLRAGITLPGLLKANPAVQTGALLLTIYDSQGNQIGISADGGYGPGGVAFDAPANGSYFAEISTSATSLVHYRLSVVAGSSATPTPTPTAGLAVKPVAPWVQILRAGQTFDFTDAAGKHVHVVYQGNPALAGRDTGTVTLTFTGGQAAGSDIASIVINGAQGGNLVVQSAGAVRVGKMAIHGLRINNRLVGTFSQIHITGSLGAVTSDTSIAALDVTGTLGAVSAAGQVIGMLFAQSFDTALMYVAGVRYLQIKSDRNLAALQTLAAANAKRQLAISIIQSTSTKPTGSTGLAP
jgi:Bacterial pre-peptidase C-terminal domain